MRSKGELIVECQKLKNGGSERHRQETNSGIHSVKNRNISVFIPSENFQNQFQLVMYYIGG